MDKPTGYATIGMLMAIAKNFAMRYGVTNIEDITLDPSGNGIQFILTTGDTVTVPFDASELPFVPGDSGLTSNNIQDAIYELKGLLENYVTLDTNQIITGKKTIDAEMEFANSSAAGTNKLTIRNDNGYNAKIKMGNTENMRLMTGGTYFGATAGVTTNNSFDLGASGAAWKDFYLKGKIALDNYIINKDNFGQLQIGNANTTSIQFDGNTIRAQNIVPMGNNQKDLGSSAMKWKDLYLAGNLSDGTNSASILDLLTISPFKKLNLTSTTLTADQMTLLQSYNVVLESDVTLGSGTTLHAQTILTRPFSYSNTLRGLYIDNSKVGTYLINTTTNILGQGAKDIVLNGIAQINSKAIPSYPSDNTKTYNLQQVNGTLTWVEDKDINLTTTMQTFDGSKELKFNGTSKYLTFTTTNNNNSKISLSTRGMALGDLFSDSCFIQLKPNQASTVNSVALIATDNGQPKIRVGTNTSGSTETLTFPYKSGTFAVTSDITPKADKSIISDAYDNTATYVVGDVVIYGDVLYKCHTAVTVAEDFDSTKWTATTVEELIKTNVPSAINYLTTAPVADNTDGDLKIVVLSSEPATKYNGYLYIWEN